MKVSTATSQSRVNAHDAACGAWADIRRGGRPAGIQSPVQGLAERIRCAKNPRPLNPAKRQAEREAAKRRQAAQWRANKYQHIPLTHDGKYLPHQGPRECARRRGDLLRAAA